jgi:hypothetical protein
MSSGPGVELVSPGPQRLALYQLTRPDASERLAHWRDFQSVLLDEP